MILFIRILLASKVYKLEKYKEIEKSIITSYRKKIWKKFVKAINEYQMIQEGDKIAVCISGGKDSMLMAKCFQEIQKHGKMKFDLVFLVMNPGYNNENKQKIIDNAEILNIPITMFETDIFERVANIKDNPCYLCARMRRGYLYKEAQKLGCNKIALGHHFDDVIETILLGMFYGAQLQTMMPKLYSTYHKGMQLIRPMYLIKEDDIKSWRDKNNLDFLQCACRLTENCEIDENDPGTSKRKEIKLLIKSLRKTYKNIDMNIYKSVQNVNLNTIISYEQDGETHHFLDDYDKRGIEKQKNL